MAIIKCPECGREISDRAAACVNCGCPINPAAVAAAQAGANRESLKPETVLMQGLCNRVTGLIVQNGSAILTNHRFVYLKHSLAKIMAVGVFTYLTKGSYDFDIPLDTISSIEDGRQGISKTIIINTKSGERYNFYVTNREEWKIKIASAMSAY